jgi:hypothetical protein
VSEPKINVRNVILGIILMCVCVSVGILSALPHQSEMVTEAINLPLQFTQQQETVSQEQVVIALQSNQAVIDVVLLTTFAKIAVIVAVAGIVFILLSTTGLIPRFGGMGD